MKSRSEYPRIRIRPEVQGKNRGSFEEEMLENLNQVISLIIVLSMESCTHIKKRIDFALFRKAAIIADEMGLGKTLQAIGTAVMKKGSSIFRKTLVVCPASLKEQWKKRFEKFSPMKGIDYRGIS